MEPQRPKFRAAARRSLVQLLSAAVLLNSCATATPPIVAVPATDQKAAHDTLVFPNGSSLDAYPNAKAPSVAVMNEDGAQVAAACMVADCSSLRLQVHGTSKVVTLAPGGYQLLQTSDPRLVLVNDVTGRETIGYLGKNNGDNGNKFFPNLHDDGAYKFFGSESEAVSYEHKGDGARLAGKIVLYTLAGVLILGLIVVAVYADQQANTITTTCTSNANSATCKSSPAL